MYIYAVFLQDPQGILEIKNQNLRVVEPVRSCILIFYVNNLMLPIFSVYLVPFEVLLPYFFLNKVRLLFSFKRKEIMIYTFFSLINGKTNPVLQAIMNLEHLLLAVSVNANTLFLNFFVTPEEIALGG